ncbi:MAG: hypothetical protein AB2A00_14840 [Myxococcota bacterium]
MRSPVCAATLLLASCALACGSERATERPPTPDRPTRSAGSAPAPTVSLPPEVPLAQATEVAALTIHQGALILDGQTLVTVGPWGWRRENMDGEWIRPLQAALEPRRWAVPEAEQESFPSKAYVRIQADQNATHALLYPVMATAASVGFHRFRLDAVDEVFGIACALPRQEQLPGLDAGVVVLLDLTAKNVQLTARNPALPQGPDNPLKRSFAPGALAELTALMAEKDAEWGRIPLRFQPDAEASYGLLLRTLAAVLKAQPWREGRFSSLLISPWMR